MLNSKHKGTLVTYDGLSFCTMTWGVYLHQVLLYLFYREVQKAVNNVQTLYRRWQDLLDNPRTVGKDEYNWTTNELRNNLRSIEWDLEDLDETVGIVEANPRKFNIDISEVNQRKQFIKQTRDSVNNIKEHMNSPSAKAKVENSSRDVSYFYYFSWG